MSMTRDEILRTISEVYRARVAGDVDAMMALVTDDARFAWNASAPMPQPPLVIEGPVAIRRALAGMVNDVEFRDLEIVDSVVEGLKAAFHTRFTACARASGKSALTETLDLVRFRDGKVSSYIQFFDTALAQQLVPPHRD
jgi:ketosteroid isomerase-like protein